MRKPCLAAAILGLSLLSACGSGGDDGANASGEVLEGTISDDMLPLDRVQSQPPLAEPEAAARARTSSGERPSGSGGEAAYAAEPATEPAAAPTPESEPTEAAAE